MGLDVQLIAAILIYLLSQFGVQPDSNTLYTHVWGTADQPTKIDNVELYIETSVVIAYKEHDTCAVYFTALRFDDGVIVFMFQRDCQDVFNSYQAAYTFTVNGIEYTEF